MIKRLLVGIGAFSLTFAVGAISCLHGWECTGIVHGKLYEGGGVFTHSRCGSRSVWIGRSTEAYPTPSYAARVFDESLRPAITVVEHNQRLDANGTKIGNRAVTVSVDSETGDRFGSVSWLDDRIIVSIKSNSVWFARFVELLDE